MTKLVEEERTALILAGAVAKGAFEAGVLQVLAERGVQIARIVGASAGSLNGAVFAAGVRCGQERAAAERLVKLWRDSADWHHVFDFSLWDVVSGKGASTMKKVRDLLGDITEGWRPQEVPIRLSLVLTALRGQEGAIGTKAATTFEGVANFTQVDFDTAEGWAKVCDAAVASASFPVVFEPAEVDGFGPCLDGGIVNNTPIKWALDGDVTQIIVVTASPRVATPPAAPRGANLLGEFVDILVNERLYRDLHDAESVNDQITQLDGLVRAGRLTAEARDTVLRQFKWRRLKVVEIRPEKELSGNPFSGFFDDEKRQEYIQAGIDAACEALR